MRSLFFTVIGVKMTYRLYRADEVMEIVPTDENDLGLKAQQTFVHTGKCTSLQVLIYHFSIVEEIPLLNRA